LFEHKPSATVDLLRSAVIQFFISSTLEHSLLLGII